MTAIDRASRGVRSAIPRLVGVLVIGLCAFNLRTMLGLIAAASVQIESELGGSGALLGALSTGAVFLVAVGSTLALLATRVVSPDRAVTLSLVLIAVSHALLFLPVTGMMWVAIVPGGLGAGMLGALTPWVIRCLLPGSTGLGIGALMGGSSLGLLISTLVSTYAESLLGSWRIAALVFCASALVCVGIWHRVARFLSSRPEAVAPTGAGVSGSSSSLKAAFKLPWLVPLILFSGLQAALAFATLAWLGPSALNAGWDESQVGVLLVLFSAAQVIGGFLAPMWTQRTKRPTRPIICASAVLVVGSVGMIPVFGWVGSADSLWAYGCLTVLALGHGATFALSNYVIASRSNSGSQAVTVGAIVLFLSQLLGAAGPLGFGILRDATTEFTVPLVVCAGVSLAILALAPLLWTQSDLDRGSRLNPR